MAMKAMQAAKAAAPPKAKKAMKLAAKNPSKRTMKVMAMKATKLATKTRAMKTKAAKSMKTKAMKTKAAMKSMKTKPLPPLSDAKTVPLKNKPKVGATAKNTNTKARIKMPTEVWKMFDTRNMVEILILSHIGKNGQIIMKGYKRSRFE